MAREPQTSGDAPKAKRKSGPRVTKDKVVFLLFKGNIESIDIKLDALEALDAKEADPSLTYRKLTIPAKKQRKPSDAPVAQTA